VALHGLKLANLTAGDYLAIFGDGPIGLLSLQLAKGCFGVSKIVVIGATPHRLQKAKELGADFIIDALQEQNVKEKLKEIGKGNLPNVAIEATNSNQSQQLAVLCVKPGGRVTMVGLSGKISSVDLDQIVLGDITIRGSLGSPWEWPETIKFVEEGKVDPGKIVSHKIPLENFHNAIDLLKSRSDGVVKVVITI